MKEVEEAKGMRIKKNTSDINQFHKNKGREC